MDVPTRKYPHKSSKGNQNPLGAPYSDSDTIASGKKSGLEAHNSSSDSLLLLMGVKRGVAQLGQKKSRNENAKNGKCSSTNGSGSGGESEHGMHIWTERERRKKIRNMFSSLHALLPRLPAKADKSTIVDEAVNYIKTLQETIQALEKQRLEKLQGATSVDDCEPSVVMASQTQALESREAFLAAQGPLAKSFSLLCRQHLPPPPPAYCQTWFSPNVVVNMCDGDAQFSVCSPCKPGLLAAIFCILEKHNLDVLSAHVSSDQYCSIYMIHARAARAFEEHPEALSVEDTFKLAAGEMNLWLLSC